MKKTKAEFINDILTNKRLDLPLKEKLIELTSKELLNTENENRKRIEELEERMKRNDIQIKKETTTTNEAHNQVRKNPIPNPLHTKNLLTLFRDSEGLKYLTHDYKDIRNKSSREDLLTIAKKEFEEAKEKYPQAKNELLRRIEEFAFKENPKWTFYKNNVKKEVNYGWSSIKFRDWEINSTVHPCRDSFWNREMIEPFKRTIEIRDGLLLDIIKETITLSFNADDLDIFTINFNENQLQIGRFFTDVDWLGQALYRIFSCIKKHGEKSNNFEISIIYLDDGIKTLKIVHHNSKANCSSNFDFTSGGDFQTIRNNLFSLCNWSIEASFENGYRRRYLLWDESIRNTDIEIKETDIEGFTYSLYFY